MFARKISGSVCGATAYGKTTRSQETNGEVIAKTDWRQLYQQSYCGTFKIEKSTHCLMLQLERKKNQDIFETWEDLSKQKIKLLRVLRESTSFFNWLYLLDTNGEIWNGQSGPGKQQKREESGEGSGASLGCHHGRGKRKDGQCSQGVLVTGVRWTKKDPAKLCSDSSDSSTIALIDAGREETCKMETDALLL